MSNVNIKRVIENIRANTTVYTPIVEMIVNAIQAIETKGNSKKGKINIRICRDKQGDLDGLPIVHSFEIEDNGIGFNNKNRNSFDELYSDLKINEGGKGFGRFTCLKYFKNLYIESVYEENGGFKNRTFSMGKDKDIIINEKILDSSNKKTGTIVHLLQIKKGDLIEKKLSTIARNLVEKLLPYFITQNYICPEIVLSEKNSTDSIKLNDFFSNELSGSIVEIPISDNFFKLKGISEEEKFIVRVFKFYSPKNHKSRISLVAHKREVSGSVIHNYVPEFIDEFYERDDKGDINVERNYIIKAYVFSEYLDRNVSLERGGFEFQMKSDVIYGIAQVSIESKSAEIAKDAVGSDVIIRQEKKIKTVESYVDEEAPWHKEILDKIDLTTMPYNPSKEEIESILQKEKFAQESQIKRDVSKILTEGDLESQKDKVAEIVDKISGTSKNDLVHYIALRRNILDIFDKSLQTNKIGQYSSEGVVHDIIFPRKGDTTITSFKDHNLWIIDERLNFTSYVSSDKELNGSKSERPDLLVYNKCISFRGDNESSNPITIFEFKKPQRDDFVNPSSKEDPVQQVVRYVNDIRSGNFLTPKGRKMCVMENTPFYGYIICDITPKVENWLKVEKDFKPMPDLLGWFQWRENINLYIEVISWDKVLKDAKMRNKIFFHKLGI